MDRIDLKFDDMEINTKLAKDYLKTINDFHSIGPSTYNIEAPTQSTIMPDYKITQIIDLEREIQNIETSYNTGLSDRLCCNIQLKTLAALIQRNINLFVQLEYLLRNKPIDDSRLQIELLLKQLNCVSSYNNKEKYILPMPTGAPLLNLGYVAKGCSTDVNIICATKDTAVFSYLFTKLCQEAGFNNFYLIITTEESIAKCSFMDYYVQKDIKTGALGIITEHSDVDSAVDVFLTCSMQLPWKLQKVLVQESVYKQFKNALSWKCSLKDVHGEDEVSNHQSLSANVFKYTDRTFLLDCIGTTSTQTTPKVIVEAYRTNKELLSLIGKQELQYLSLWTNDIAESNEIAHNVKSNVIWLNNFAEFRGPDRISDAVYAGAHTRWVKKTNSISELYKLSESWLKLDVEGRHKIICEAIDKYVARMKSSTEATIVLDLKNQLTTGIQNAFVEVGTDYVCTILDRPVGIVGISCMNESLLNLHTLQLILLGNAFAIDKKDKLIDVFENTVVPVIHTELIEGFDYKININVNNATKAIWMNLGTIFAN